MYRDKQCQHHNLETAKVETVINQGLLAQALKDFNYLTSLIFSGVFYNSNTLNLQHSSFIALL